MDVPILCLGKDFVYELIIKQMICVHISIFKADMEEIHIYPDLTYRC